MGYVDEATGAWVYEESDNPTTDPEYGSFSGMLSRGAKQVPDQVSRALASDATIRQAAVDLVDDEIADRNLIEGGDAAGVAGYLWRLKYQSGETAFGRRADGEYVMPGFDVVIDSNPAWYWCLRYAGNGEVALGRRRDTGEIVGAGLAGGTSTAKLSIVEVGDSLTAGRVGTADSELAAALGGRTITNIGIGGQTAPSILARFGSAPAMLTLEGNAIPAAVTPVAVTAYSINPGSFSSGTGTRTINGVLAGVPVALTITGNAGAYSLTVQRLTPGYATVCPPTSPFQTGFSYRDQVPIIRVGRNGASATPEQIVGLVEGALKWSRHRDKALVLPIPPWTSDNATERARYASINNALRDTFPAQWLDDAAALRSEAALQSVGLTPNASDQADIAAGNTPSQFRSDEGHWNLPAYRVSNRLITAALTARL